MADVEIMLADMIAMVIMIIVDIVDMFGREGDIGNSVILILQMLLYKTLKIIKLDYINLSLAKFAIFD